MDYQNEIVFNILSLICFVRMDFSEKYRIKDEARDVRSDEKFISSKTYKNNSMFIKDLVRWHHWHDIILTSH